MFLNRQSTVLSFIVFSLCHQIITADVIDCQRPPQLVDPATCCKDGGRDEVTEKCALRMGITGQPTDPQPSVETATCLAQCILTESKYMPQVENLDLDAIRTDLQAKFSNDSAYAETMVEAFRKCQPNTLKKLQAFKQMPMGRASLQRGCSPFAGMLLGCAYMEYFKNCPAHRWTENPECKLAKQFVMQCSLGA
ncbi:uncharacterized protein LOC106088938 [Stomoxys calcitrans]|uniref:OBP47-like domain-containing protein n=1 Tax=Stomoxys calcitrans TaxID=35570 RepID=A0A1I8P8R2_STOCA|nr:uncharacterized protein LOC106088938 [Stomoxys calcitrans]